MCGGGGVSPDTEKNLVIGRLSEDRGYCIPTGGLQLQRCKQHTVTQTVIQHTVLLRAGQQNNRGRKIYNK